MKTLQQRFAELMSHLNASDGVAFDLANTIKGELEEIAEIVQHNYDPEFDYEVEHWDNGNYDDSFDYGRECGLNAMASDHTHYFVEEGK